jgi:glucose/arabinose dehydrogenase
VILWALAYSLAVGASAADAAESWTPATGIEARVVVEGLEAPLFVATPDTSGSRIFVVEQTGRIRIVRDGRVLPRPFLDLSNLTSAGGERGLLGLAFHPSYHENGAFFVDFTDRVGNTRIMRFRVSANPDRADSASGRLVLRVVQPYPNHNGGMLAFGRDGMLYVGMGDGGSGGDPHGYGQSRATLLGKILRLDIDHGHPYAIPRDNPFADSVGARGEIWSYGMRNPWRFAFGRADSMLYVADVGQDRWEEIDVVPDSARGLNYGWNVREGAHPFHAVEGATGPFVEPAAEYGHEDGCSVTGGYPYRGEALAGLQGTYFFSDWCGGWLRSFRWEHGRAVERRQWDVGPLGPVTSFGEDAHGELYLTTSHGRVFELTPRR